MRRYSIIVREHGSDRDIELMQVESNPSEIVKGLRLKMLTIRHSLFQAGPRTSKVPKYTWIEVRDNMGGGS
jgi:hypothetical protein